MKRIRLAPAAVKRITWLFPIVSLAVGGGIVCHQTMREASLRSELTAVIAELKRLQPASKKTPHSSGPVGRSSTSDQGHEGHGH